MTSNGHLFNTVIVTNASVGGVTFADRLQAATLTDTTDGSTLKFSAASVGSPHTITSALNITGGASKITLAPSVAATTWYLTAPTPTTVTNVNVSYSNSTNHITPVTSTDGTHNVNWDFDTTPPVTTATATSGGNSYTFGTWASSTVAVTLSCADNGGGVGCDTTNYPKYCTDTANSCTPATKYTGAVSTTTEGVSYIRYYSADTIPNAETVKSSVIWIDTTNPTSAITSPSDNSFSSSTTVALTGTSADTNLSTTKISVDGGTLTATGGTAAAWTYSATGLSQGAHTFRSQATDLASNTGSSTLIHVTVDTIAPTAGTVTAPTADTYQSATSYNWQWSAGSDGGSGLHATTPYHLYTYTDSACSAGTVDRGATTGTNMTVSSGLTNGNSYYANVVYMDKAGNVSTSTCSASKVMIDSTAPSIATTTFSGFTAYSTTTNYIKGTGTIIGGTATDTGGSGVNNATCEYTTNNGSTWSSGFWNVNHCEATGITISDGTSYTFNTRVKDVATNQGTGIATSTYIGDLTAPATTDNSNASSPWNAIDQTVTLSPSDTGGSGVAHTYYCTYNSGGSCDPTTGGTLGTSVVVTCATNNTCEQYVKYYSVDNLGNSESGSVKTSHLINIDKQGPTVSASATANGSSYSFGDWTAANVAVTLTCSDSPGSGCAAIYYCQDTIDACLPTTLYTAPVTASSSGAEYIRYYSTDTLGNSSATTSQIINISNVPLPPTLTADSLTQITASWSANGNPVGTQYYIENVTNSTNSGWIDGTSWISAGLNCGTNYSFRVKARSVDLTETASGATATGQTRTCPSISSSGGYSGGYGGYGYYYYIPASTTTPSTVITYVNNVAQNLISGLLGNPQETTPITYPPIELSVPTTTPAALQGLRVMSVNPLGNFALSPIGTTVIWFANKLPQLQDTLNALNINANKLSDVAKLSNAQLYLPGLTQTILSPQEILQANKLANVNQPPVTGINAASQKGLLAPESLQSNALAMITNIPLAEFSASAIAKIPTNMVFARTAGETVDLASALTVDKQGNTEQKITTISGKPLQLIIKPSNPASRVTGLMTLKSLDAMNGQAKPAVADTSGTSGKNGKSVKGGTETLASLFNGYDLTASANLAAARQTSGSQTGNAALNLAAIGQAVTGASNVSSGADSNTSSNNQQTALLVQKFAYTETKPGVFTADINAPTDEGQYEITTIVEYKDANLTPTATKLITVVDPEGYVYKQTADGKLRIQSATVSIYWLNPSTNQYELWPADKFMQKNPVVTDDTGKYSFLVPAGKYYMTAVAANYSNWKSDPFSITEDNGIRMDIEMKKNTWLPDWLNWFNWEAVIAVLLLVIVFRLVFPNVLQKILPRRFGGRINSINNKYNTRSGFPRGSAAMTL